MKHASPLAGVTLVLIDTWFGFRIEGLDDEACLATCRRHAGLDRHLGEEPARGI